MASASRPRPGLYNGKVHVWIKHDAVSVRSLCGSVTAMRLAVVFKFPDGLIHCMVCKMRRDLS